MNKAQAGNIRVGLRLQDRFGNVMSGQMGTASMA
jgi:hypothetical protein